MIGDITCSSLTECQRTTPLLADDRLRVHLCNDG